jgi:signal transduction histidine kinase
VPPSDAESWPASQTLVHRLSSSLAHNVNNSLTGVIGYMEMAARSAAPGSDQSLQLQSGLKCAYQVADTIRRLVLFSFSANGEAHTGRMSLCEVAKEAVRMAIDRYPNPAITWKVVADSDGWAQADPLLIHNSMEQLLANAVEAMPEGGTVTLRIWESVDQCHLAVSDTGAGFPDETKEHLGEPFVTTKLSGHLGVGLALCRRWLAMQGGSLHLSSVPGEGTHATMSLPADPVSPDGKKQNAKLEELLNRGWQTEAPHLPRSPVAALTRAMEGVARPG